MKKPATRLAALWQQHRSRPFPRDRPESELAGVDYFDLVGLDTFLAGYLSRVVEGERLQGEDLMNLQRLESELRTKLRAVSGQTHEYFHSLAELAQSAIAAVHPRH